VAKGRTDKSTCLDIAFYCLKHDKYMFKMLKRFCINTRRMPQNVVEPIGGIAGS